MNIKKRIKEASDQCDVRIDFLITQASARLSQLEPKPVRKYDGSNQYIQVLGPDQCQERHQFLRSAVWFWCLLWGHWEYYKALGPKTSLGFWITY